VASPLENFTYPGTMHEYLKTIMEGTADVELISYERVPMLQDSDGCTISFKIKPS